ncbi:major head protein [Pantoea phage vB_PagM_LIET2]|uniref:Major capsid protein n=1 Tax=Pantoea phage vB_PagM_LIET2 TaxID=2508071 RepID=A0A411AW05_9CAUD|nr:major head protein [Pantoea phage vB_PagM_LIET2]QAX92284.1 major capsid protein [Pantoea phage vB_PagM_LIET2]UJH95932.1 major capsid protein [Pantoea phage Nafs113]
MPQLNYDEAEMRYFRDHSEVRLDEAESIFLARELDALRARVFEAEFPGLNALQIFPVQSEAASWQKTFTYGLMSEFGIAKIVSDYADDIPMVGVMGQWETCTIYRIADAYQFSLDEIRAAQALGKNLNGRLALAARRGCDAKINELAFKGDAAYNIVGLFNHPNLTWVSASLSWTAGGSGKTGSAAAFDDLVKAIGIVNTVTKGLHNANRIVIPPSMTTVLTAQLPNTSISYKSFLLQEYPNMAIYTAQELEAGPGGKPCAIVFEYDADSLAIELSQPFEQMPAVWNNFHAKVACSARTAGLIVYKPQTTVIITSLIEGSGNEQNKPA